MHMSKRFSWYSIIAVPRKEKKTDEPSGRQDILADQILQFSLFKHISGPRLCASLVMNKNGLLFPICSSMTLRRPLTLGQASKKKKLPYIQNSYSDLCLYHHMALYN